MGNTLVSKGLPLMLAASLVWAAPGRSVEDPYRKVSLALGQELVAFFPPVEGFVVSVKGEEVFTDLGEKDLVRQGVELLVYRPGADIVHPATGEVLGQFEENLGYLALREVREKYSRGMMAEGAAQVRSGDRVRITARRLRALLLLSGGAPGIDTWRLSQALAEMGEVSKRFQILEEPEWRPSLQAVGRTLDEVLTDTGSLRRLGEEVPAELLLIVRPQRREDVTELLLEVLSLRTGFTLGEFARPWSAGPGAVEARIPPPTPETGPAAEYLNKELPTAVRSMIAEDLDGDGRLEILISDGRRLTIYRWEDGGLIWKWEERGPLFWQVLYLEAGDVDADGRIEIFTTAVRHGRLKTTVWSWEKNGRENRAEVEGVFLRVLRRPGGGTVLFGQRRGVREVFSGRVEEYTCDEGSCRPAGRGVLPRGVNLFGLGLADLAGDGKMQILSLSEGGLLRVYSEEGQPIWQGSEHYGGYPVKITAADLFGSFALSDDGSKDLDETDYDARVKDFRKAFQGRVLIEGGPSGGDPVRVMIPRNFADLGFTLSRWRAYGKGEIVSLKWEGGGFVEASRSRAFEGYISDIAEGDTDGDGRPEVLVTVNRPSSFLLGEKGRLVVWRHTGE